MQQVSTQQNTRGESSRVESTTRAKGADRGSNTPGTTGRPMNRRKDIEEDDLSVEVAKKPNRGAMTGGTRSAKVLQKNRKGKRAA
jgi:hypothetical protein